MITVGKPSSTRHGGRFYNVSRDGKPIRLTTINCPLRTYGINRYGSVYLYADENSIEDGVKEFIREYEDIESEILVGLERRGEKVKKLASRLTTSKTSDTLKRITAKFTFEDKDKTVVSDLVRDIDNNKLTTDELKKGNCYEIYPVITISSIFVNSTKGIIPQLHITEAYLFPIEDNKAPILNLETIRERYASLLLSKRMKHIKFEHKKDEE